MLGIDTKVGVAHIGHASGYVICLIQRKAIQPGGKSRAEDGSANDQEHHDDEQLFAETRQPLRNCLGKRNGMRIHKSSI